MITHRTLVLPVSTLGLAACLSLSALVVEQRHDQSLSPASLSRVVGYGGAPPCDPTLMSWGGGCFTGVDITACPAAPCETFSCNSDCSPVAGEASGGSTLTNGYFVPPAKCSVLGSTYQLLRCGPAAGGICPCNVPNPVGPRFFACPRTTSRFVVCDEN